MMNKLVRAYQQRRKQNFITLTPDVFGQPLETDGHRSNDERQQREMVQSDLKSVASVRDVPENLRLVIFEKPAK
jgi:hypothetical protein